MQMAEQNITTQKDNRVDTHAEFKHLVSENIPADQAEAIIKVIQQIVLGSIASKADVENIGYRINELTSGIKVDGEKYIELLKGVVRDSNRISEENYASIERRINMRLDSFENELQNNDKKTKEMIEAVITKISRVQASLPDKEEISRQFEDMEINMTSKIEQMYKSLNGGGVMAKVVLPVIYISLLIVGIFI